MTEGKLNSLLLRVVPPITAWLMRIWFSTCTVTEHGREHVFRADDKEPLVIASLWHYALVFVFYYFRRFRITAMVSASRDGDYIARLANQFGFETSRGSRNQQGVAALKAMLRAVKNGRNGAIVADGSQGPPRVAQPGALLVAARTGVPIIPLVWSASRYFTIRSWDRTAVPKPFARIDLFYGEPLFIPPRPSDADIERYRQELEQRLNALYKKAWALYGRNEH